MLDWNNRSEEWKQGWKDANQNKDLRMSVEERASKSDEWRSGLKYAIQNRLPYGIVELYLKEVSRNV